MTTTVNTLPKTKARLSVAIDIEQKKALETYAKAQNRSVHFVMLEMIDEKLKQAQEEAEYQEYIKNRVLLTEKRLKEQGADNLSMEQVKNEVKNFLGLK